MKRNCQQQNQAGVMLIEALVAILIFTVGILGIVGLQAVSIKQGTDSRYRSDAAMLANQLIGTMWLGDRTAATLQATYSTGGTGYATWSTVVANTLPGAGDHPPTVVFGPTGIVNIEIQWIAPNEPANAAPHRYNAVALPSIGVTPL